MSVQEIAEVRMSITPVLPQSQPDALVVPSPGVPGTRVLLPLALTTGGLLWLCYFPVACGWLAWFALVPLLVLIRSPARPRTVYLSAFLGGLVFYWPALQWMRVADPRMYYTWGFLATLCAAYFPLAIFIVRYLERRTPLPLVLTLPVVWTALEFFRCHFGTGFSWYLIGHTQHDWLPIIQIADITGAYGVSFLVVAVNAVLFEMCWRRARRGTLAIQAVVVVAAMAGTLVYGFVRLNQAAFTAGPRVALIQGSVDQQIRNQANVIFQVTHIYPSLTNVAIMYRPDLIVWPETSCPGEFAVVPPTSRTPGIARSLEKGECRE